MVFDDQRPETEISLEKKKKQIYLSIDEYRLNRDRKDTDQILFYFSLGIIERLFLATLCIRLFGFIFLLTIVLL